MSAHGGQKNPVHIMVPVAGRRGDQTPFHLQLPVATCGGYEIRVNLQVPVAVGGVHGIPFLKLEQIAARLKCHEYVHIVLYH